MKIIKYTDNDELNKQKKEGSPVYAVHQSPTQESLTKEGLINSSTDTLRSLARESDSWKGSIASGSIMQLTQYSTRPAVFLWHWESDSKRHSRTWNNRASLHL